MQKTNTSFIKLIAIAIVAVAIVYFVNKQFSKVKFDKNGNRMVTEQDIKNGLKKVSSKYGVDYARQVERLFRVETSHFKSGQFLKTLSPGMEISGSSKSLVFPFGWSLSEFVQSYDPMIKSKFYTHTMNENGTGLKKTFVGFPDINSSMMFVAWMIKNKRGGRFGNWKSLTESSALAYEKTMATVVARYI